MTPSSSGAVVRIGTRGSALAQAQTASVVKALRESYPQLSVQTVIIRTSGDRQHREVVGAFVKEIQEALLQGAIDVAVHSLKDLPTHPVAGLRLAAIPPRADVRDVLISKRGHFSDLAQGSRVGTGCLRRVTQLRWLRPDLQYLPLVGNVDTRIRKLHEGEYDAIVLAAAGLQRLGFLESPEDSVLTTREGTRLHVHLFDINQVIPAPGQGALALECREGDRAIIELLEPLEHPPSRQAVTAERSVLQALGGGCRVPIAAYATVEGNVLRLLARVNDPKGEAVLTEAIEGAAEHAMSLGVQLAQRLLRVGARDLLGTEA